LAQPAAPRYTVRAASLDGRLGGVWVEREREGERVGTRPQNRVEDLLVSSLTQDLRLSKNKMPLDSFPLLPPPFSLSPPAPASLSHPRPILARPSGVRRGGAEARTR
jgi:hypothetical protein